MARKELDKINKELGVGEKQTNKLSGALKGVGGVIVAAFTIDKLIDFGRQVISITAEFQKLKAVLINTLGSRSAADQAFQNIQKFAANTPFQVNQITDSFVKLANQGFVPTTKELTKLGDLAASTGKEFDQLTEAIIDAQVGEFERLKEFGIRASKEGDNVTFTFKGVQTQVDFTAESIQGYILSLGELQGVSGSMAAISETLGGKISNLQDGIDALFFEIGTNLNPVIGGAIDVMGSLISTITKFIGTPFVQQLRLQQTELNVLVGAITDVNTSEQARSNLLTELNSKYPDFLRNLDSEKVTNEQLVARMSDVNDQFLRKIALTAAEDRLAEQQEELLDNIEREASLRKALVAQREREEQIRSGNARRQRGDAGLIAKLESQVNQVTAEREGIQKSLQDQLKTYTEALDLFNTENNDYFETTEKANEADAKRIALLSIESKLLKDRETRIKANKELFGDVLDQTEKLGSDIEDLTKENADLNRSLIEQNDITRRSAKAQEDLEAAERAILEKRKANFEALFSVIDSINQEIFLRVQQNLDGELASIRENTEEKILALEEERDRKLEIVGSDADSRKAIEKQFQQDKAKIDQEIADKESEIRIRSAKIQKASAAFNTIINTAQAVIAALAPPPLGLGPVFGAPIATATGIAGAAQLALILSRPIPKFAEGVLNLQGGVKGKDSVPSLLMPGESVMTTNETRDFMPTLKAIRENRIDPEILNAVANGKGGGVQVHNSVVEVPRDTVIWDEDGFSYYMNRKNSTVQRKGVRYKC